MEWFTARKYKYRSFFRKGNFCGEEIKCMLFPVIAGGRTPCRWWICWLGTPTVILDRLSLQVIGASLVQPKQTACQRCWGERYLGSYYSQFYCPRFCIGWRCWRPETLNLFSRRGRGFHLAQWWGSPCSISGFQRLWRLFQEQKPGLHSVLQWYILVLCPAPSKLGIFRNGVLSAMQLRVVLYPAIHLLWHVLDYHSCGGFQMGGVFLRWTSYGWYRHTSSWCCLCQLQSISASWFRASNCWQIV